MMSFVGLLTVVSLVVNGGQNAAPDISGLILFAAAAFGVVAGNAVGQRLSVAVVEEMLHERRVALSEEIRRLECSDFEAIGGGRIYDSLTRNSAILSEAAMMAVPAFSAAGSLVLAGFFTLTLSPLIFAAFAVILLASTVVFRRSQRRTREAMERSSADETAFLSLLGHLLHGFKEVKLFEPRADALEAGYLVPASATLQSSQLDSAARINRGIYLSYFFFYLILGTVAFLLPPLIKDAGIVAQGIYVGVFLLSLVEIILRSVPLLTRANFALDSLHDIEAALQAVAGQEPAMGSRPAFRRIALEGATFSYRDPAGQPTYTVGPVSLEIERGELVFVAGGNGSGKSTFLKLLCRLYPQDSGTLLLDGEPVVTETVNDYRSLFSAVFADFHLFDRLYGLTDRTDEEVNDLLRELGIGDKTSYVGGRFSSTDLSTGQRKRLALAVALLERRPILILDELAADQDPEFRRHFYEAILPRLKKEGRTLIVVSHDERYFGGADRVLTLRDGRIAPNREEGDGRP